MGKDGGGPKILCYDIESAGVQSLYADRGFMVCFGYKFLGDKQAKCISLNDYPGKHVHDDKNLLTAALEIMQKADLLVAHYGDKFDRKFIEARLLRNRLPPLPITRQVDTCLISRFRLKLSSNRLGNLAEFLQVKTGKMNKRGGWPDWWMGALRGDRQSIKEMQAYCAQDVQCLEECYLALRQIIPEKYLINLAVGNELNACKSCGNIGIKHEGRYYSPTRSYQRYSCKACGKWGRYNVVLNGPFSASDKHKTKHSLRR